MEFRIGVDGVQHFKQLQPYQGTSEQAILIHLP